MPFRGIKLDIWNLRSELRQRILIRENSETIKNCLYTVNFTNWYNKTLLDKINIWIDVSTVAC